MHCIRYLKGLYRQLTHTQTHTCICTCAGDVPLPQVSTDTQELVSSDHESDTSVTVTVVKAEVHVNEGAIETEVDVAPVLSLQDQPVIRAKVNTNAVSPRAAIETIKPVVSQADIDGEPAADNHQTITGPPLYMAIMKEDALQAETKAHVEDIEDVDAAAVGSMSASTADNSASVLTSEGNESTVISNSNQELSIQCRGPRLPSEYLEPSTTTLPSADESSTKEGTTSYINTTEREKRLSALKDAWASQDNEDVAYLQVVL